MKYKLTTILLFVLLSNINANELKIKANSFKSDENIGVSIFTGKVNIQKSNDELNASKVIVHTDKENKPTKFVATGNVSFTIQTENNKTYVGVAQKAIYFPNIKEYHFFKDVHLQQVDEKKEIIGDEVVLKIQEGKAFAKGIESKPVIMVFDIAENNETKEK